MNLEFLLNYLGSSLREMKADIQKLNSVQGVDHKLTINRLSERLAAMDRYLQAYRASANFPHPSFGMDVPNMSAGPRTFTVAELAQYDGKNGKPAYIAVNGIVYDMTGIAAWAAGTHFGLVAGNDLSAQFASCHSQKEILSKLPAVGVLSIPAGGM
jgi:predicted heme/steroid binding protein